MISFEGIALIKMMVLWIACNDDYDEFTVETFNLMLL